MWRLIKHGFGVGLGMIVGNFVWQAMHDHNWMAACEHAFFELAGISILILVLCIHQKIGGIKIQ